MHDRVRAAKRALDLVGMRAAEIECHGVAARACDRRLVHEAAHRLAARGKTTAIRRTDEAVGAGDGNRTFTQNHFQPCFA